ncbi:hypothetical protein HGT71_15525 [Rosenbergiella epipactidis]|uniref:hypothetical protein n=1 Tax=Rosenbergiella epipactidis TaxID=1544694 RepID=UPI001BD972B6|nr:hypothetical protein [Rosenbergiella epipactidis]MBT0719653.1 hypothetical protein [Rosenbergiella epipactidis]
MSRFKPVDVPPIPEDFLHHEDMNFPHPVTGEVCWGYVRVTSQHLNQPGGPIYLRAGKHIGPHKGFGIRHIWEQHGADLIRGGYRTFNDVPRFVSDIIVDGANIVCEFNAMKSHDRLIILRGRKGRVILSAWSNGDDEFYYSVVTAFRNGASNGTAVGRVEVNHGGSKT